MEGKKPPLPPVFPLQLLQMLGLAPKTSATLVLNFKSIICATPKLLDLKQDHSSKKWFFWTNPYEIEVMVTSLVEILELPNFGHITTSTI